MDQAVHKDVTTEPFHYADFTAPKGYECGKCGATGVKLWRDYNTFLVHQSLRCIKCACEQQKLTIPQNLLDDDQIAGLVPAVPTEDGETYWGYTSVPIMGVIWWKRLNGPAWSREEILRDIEQGKAHAQLWDEVSDRYDPEFITTQKAATLTGLREAEKALAELDARPAS